MRLFFNTTLSCESSARPPLLQTIPLRASIRCSIRKRDGSGVRSTRRSARLNTQTRASSWTLDCRGGWRIPGNHIWRAGCQHGLRRARRLGLRSRALPARDTLRILEGNDVAQFRISLVDNDGPGGDGDEFFYDVDTFDYEIAEWDVFVRPLTDFSGMGGTNGDGEMNFGLRALQLMTFWGQAEALNVELGGIYITEIEPTPSETIFELSANNFGQAWMWGSYSADGAITYVDDSIVIDAESQGGDAGAQGGLGHGVLTTNFDGETSELVINAKLLENNEATSFLIELRDDDDELNGVITGGVEELEWAAEQYTYEVVTDEFNEQEFTEVRIPFTDFTNRGQGGGDVNLDGDAEPNFGLYLAHIMSPWGPAERLNIEIQSIRVEPASGGIRGL